MTEQYETGLDPNEIFNEGAAAERSHLQDELSARLQSDLGLSPEEAEALFDPRPRKHKGRKGKRACTAKQWAKMPQICSGSRHKARRYDPAPDPRPRHRRSRRYDPDPAPSRYTTKVRKYAKQAKGTVSKLMDKVEPYIPVGVGVLTFYSLYQTRLDALKLAGRLNKDGTPVATVIDAIMYDINNWSAAAPIGGGGMTGAIDRLQANWGPILGGVLGGLVVDEFSRDTKFSKMGRIAGKSLVAYGAAQAAKSILDPPTTSGLPVRRINGTVTQGQAVQASNGVIDQNRMRSQSSVQPVASSSGFVNPY